MSKLESDKGAPKYSTESTESYVEDEPTVQEWFQGVKPSAGDVKSYLVALFPFIQWIGRYNFTWLQGDLIAGITVGFVVIPQSMAYAGLALLKPEFGLYSSFVGVVIYWFFATSKDITIGPVAVMSTLVGNIVKKAGESHPEIPPEDVASSLALVCGLIVFAFGMLRLGFIVDYIPLPALAAFMTGSALSIAMSQIPTLFGISSKIVNNREATYKVFINFWKHIEESKIDAAMGLSALCLLYFIKHGSIRMGKRYPKSQKKWFFISTLRTAFVILLYTMISWLVNRNHRDAPKFRIIQTVPKGFKHMGAPQLNSNIVSSFASELPPAVIVLLIEHIAIAKSFGRINNYTINPSQEMIAIGITNIFGPFFGAYPATGSFSRTAIKSKAGVRTPFAGVITGVVLLLAIYLLTSVFYFIPNAGLAAVIIHAVGDLITPPKTLYRFWRVSPLEVVIFFAGVITTVFSTIENGIYITVCASLGLLLFRMAKAHGHLLGRVKVYSVIGDHLLSNPNKVDGNSPQDSIRKTQDVNAGVITGEAKDQKRYLYLPFDHRDGSNPDVNIDMPYPGIFVYRFSEGLIYPNANHYTDQLVEHIFRKSRRTNPAAYANVGDRPWNDKAPRQVQEIIAQTSVKEEPILKAVILDFSAVNNVDVTSVQVLIDVRNQLDRYASPEPVDWYFAAITNRWTKRALASAGFGYPADVDGSGNSRGKWKPVFSVADIFDNTNDAESDEESQQPFTGVSNKKKRVANIISIKKPLFHVDLDSALTAAIENAKAE